MKLFCFASRSDDNIRRGVLAKRWAVATVSHPAMLSRIGKARKYFRPGDVGLLYSNTRHSFTVPFVVSSNVDTTEVVTDIWPEPWVLPFDITPLGNGCSAVSKEDARLRWTLFDRLPWKGSISATLNFTGTTVFVPTEITEQEWRFIVHDLGED